MVENNLGGVGSDLLSWRWLGRPPEENISYYVYCIQGYFKCFACTNYVNPHSSTRECTIIIPMWQVRKPGHRDIKWQHIICKWWKLDLSLHCQAPRACSHDHSDDHPLSRQREEHALSAQDRKKCRVTKALGKICGEASRDGGSHQLELELRWGPSRTWSEGLDFILSTMENQAGFKPGSHMMRCFLTG